MGNRINRKAARWSLASLFVCVSLAGHVHAGGFLDQENVGPQWGSGVIGELPSFGFKVSRGQTFDVGQTGQLTSVEVDLFKSGAPTAPLTLDIRPVNGIAPELTAGASLGSISLLPSQVSNGWVSFDLSAANISVNAGDKLAFVLESTQDFSGNQNQYGFTISGSGTNTDYYPGGHLWDQNNGGAWEHTIGNPSYDMRFRTFVTPEPASACLMLLGGLLAIRRR